MERMLGNQYFMARRFEDAIPCFENALRKTPSDPGIMKHLIGCYVMTGNIEGALHNLGDLLARGIAKGIDPLPDAEEDAFRQMLAEWYRKPPRTQSRFEYLLSIAILTLLCEPELAPAYFKEAQKLAPKHELLREISEKVTSHNADLEI
ncbi:hypothetical protein MJD09_21745 [bacterium]|nr:hypothetical protein [bacterium]